MGIKLAPDGNNRDEFEYLKTKVDKWVEKIRTKKLPRHLVWQSLTTGMYRSLIFPLAVTTFSRAECHRLMSPLLQTGLSFSGIDRSISRDIVHSPLSRGGLALPDLFIEQGIAHAGRLLRFGKSYHHITGYLIRANLENLTMELGLPGIPFEHEYHKWKGTFTRSWITCSWKFQSIFNIKIQTDGPQLKLRCHGDAFLSELFASQQLCPAQRRMLNFCRQYLQVVTVSDIVDVQGIRVLPACWQGKKGSVLMNTYTGLGNPRLND